MSHHPGPGVQIPQQNYSYSFTPNTPPRPKAPPKDMGYRQPGALPKIEQQPRATVYRIPEAPQRRQREGRGDDYIWPVNGGRISSGIHDGNAVDIGGVPEGSDIYALSAGMVTSVSKNGSWNHGYGNEVVIRQFNGVELQYAHARQVFVSVGDEVTEGQLIATIGSTGKAYAPHLHLGVKGAPNPFGGYSTVRK